MGTTISWGKLDVQQDLMRNLSMDGCFWYPLQSKADGNGSSIFAYLILCAPSSAVIPTESESSKDLGRRT